MGLLSKLLGKDDKDNRTQKSNEFTEKSNERGTSNMKTIVSNAKEASWNNLEDVVKLKPAIKNTLSVDFQVLNITEQQLQKLAQQTPLDTNFRDIDEQYQIRLSSNSIFIHPHGAFIDFGYVMFLYREKLYYVNVDPTVRLETSIYNRMDALSHMAKIMIVLNKHIGHERKTLLIRLEGDLEQKKK